MKRDRYKDPIPPKESSGQRQSTRDNVGSKRKFEENSSDQRRCWLSETRIGFCLKKKEQRTRKKFWTLKKYIRVKNLKQRSKSMHLWSINL